MEHVDPIAGSGVQSPASTSAADPPTVPPDEAQGVTAGETVDPPADRPGASASPDNRGFRTAQKVVATAAALVVGVGAFVLVYELGRRTGRVSFSPGGHPPSLTQAQQLQQQIAVLQSRQDTSSNLQSFLLVALTVLLALGGLTSVVSWFRTEGRQHQDADVRLQISGVALAAARSAERRDEAVHSAFLGGSKQMLDMMVATLRVAQETSDLAAHATERNAQKLLASLDEKARDLLGHAISRADHELVSDPILRAQIASLGDRIAGLEDLQFLLPSEMTFSAACLFIRGLHHHLAQQFDEALHCWDRVVTDPKADQELTSRAYYWLGYERNSLGEFVAAEKNFERAKPGTSGDRRVELDRLHLESRFFDRMSESADKLATYGLRILESHDEGRLDEATIVERNKLAATIGNICHEAGREALSAGHADAAREWFLKAREQFDHEPPRDAWADFGLAEVAYELGDTATAAELFNGPVRVAAIAEYLNRVEPRTRVRAKATELICLCRTCDASDPRIEVAHHQMLEALRQVDDRLTVYSPLQRRNVTKDDLRSEMDALVSAPRTISIPAENSVHSEY